MLETIFSVAAGPTHPAEGVFTVLLSVSLFTIKSQIMWRNSLVVRVFLSASDNAAPRGYLGIALVFILLAPV